jgi:Tat protein translocase TatB subunit
MFDIGFGEMVLLAAIALVAIGPKQLPEVARVLGRLLAEFKKATGDFTKSIAEARDTAHGALNETAQSVNQSLAQTAQQVNEAVRQAADAANAPTATPAHGAVPIGSPIGSAGTAAMNNAIESSNAHPQHGPQQGQESQSPMAAADATTAPSVERKES